ncbi:MAG: TonB-dependent receptor, partial [Candidatus Latescibacteria bacterium]|nr:TonB-dependent receptor [Candidatus Latescibacterota bacterium]
MALARKKRLVIFLCLGVGVIAATVKSPSCGGLRTSASLSKTARLSGIVQGSQTRKPVPYAILSIVELQRGTVSDKNGRFTFQDIPFGNCTLLVDKTGYSPINFPIDFTPQTPQPMIISLAPLNNDLYLTGLEPRTYRVEPIVVTASRKEQPADQVPQNVTVLTKDEIESLPAHNLAEALNYVPGLAVQINGGPGNIAYPMIQGAEYRHTLVLIDGIPINTQTEGWADISQIPLEEIERIEVQKGPGSSVWGSSLGGVINVITRSPSKQMRGDLGFSFGERNTQQYHLGASGTVADVGYLFTLRQLETDGFRPKNGYQGDNLFAKVETYISESAKISGSFGHNNGEGAGDEFMTPDSLRYWTDYKRRNSYATLRLETIPANWMGLRVFLQGIEQDLESCFFQIGSEDLLSSTQVDERTLGAGVQTLIILNDSNTTTAGLDLSWSKLDSENIGGKREANRKAIWFNNQTNTDRFTLILGGRFDYASAYGRQFSPNIGAVYRLPKWKTILRAALSRGFGAPPLSFKYYENPGRRQLANPDIEPERVWSYQAGLENSYL